MRRTLVIALIVLGTGASPAGAAVPPDAARARLVACHAGLEPISRYVVAEASMRSLRAGDRKQLRIELYRRGVPGGRAVRVGGPGLGTWNDAAPGVARFRFRKTIANLSVRAQYRVVVRYRWLDDAGEPVARTTRRTAWCAEPDPRPNLRPLSVTTAAGPGANRSTYFVLVRNTGVSPTGDFDVELTIAGSREPPVTASGLQPGERRAFAIVGRECPENGSVHVVVDPDNRVDEANEGDDQATFSCA